MDIVGLMKQNQKGFGHLIIVIIVVLVAAVGFVGWRVLATNKDKKQTSTTPPASTSTQKQPDSASTIASPQKVTTSDGEQYFYYGAPAGQNNASPKRIVIDLPGHETKAEDGYAAWLPYIKDGKYALAALNWWDGNGSTSEHYYSPAEALAQVKPFLKAQGYSSSDLIILFGYSRGSANTYAVEANDRVSSSPVFDAVISASGGYQSDFTLITGQSNASTSSTLYKGIYWVLACGGQDPDPNRAGCPAMENTTKPFLEQHGATVLGILEDPNEGHGAFHLSTLNMPKQAFDLIEAKAL